MHIYRGFTLLPALVFSGMVALGVLQILEWVFVAQQTQNQTQLYLNTKQQLIETQKLAVAKLRQGQTHAYVNERMAVSFMRLYQLPKGDVWKILIKHLMPPYCELEASYLSVSQGLLQALAVIERCFAAEKEIWYP